MADSSKFPTCNCIDPWCNCAGNIHSYSPYYREILNRIQPRKVFEWGPGNNTYLALETPSVLSVISIEQNLKWIPKIDDPRFEALVISKYHPKYVDLHGHEDADIFFIDSRWRAQCLDLVRTQAQAKAIICLHDAQRSRYHKALARYKKVEFFGIDFAVGMNVPHPHLTDLWN